MKKKHVALALAAAMAVTTVGGGQLYMLLKSTDHPAKRHRHGRTMTHVSQKSEQRQTWLNVKL